MAGRAAMQFRQVQPHEGPSQEALTVAFTPGSMPGHVGAIEVDVQGNITGFYLIMRVAGREAMVNCSVQMAWWAPYGQNRNAHPEERRRGRRTRRRQNRNHALLPVAPFLVRLARSAEPGLRLGQPVRSAMRN